MTTLLDVALTLAIIIALSAILGRTNTGNVIGGLVLLSIVAQIIKEVRRR